MLKIFVSLRLKVIGQSYGHKLNAKVFIKFPTSKKNEVKSGFLMFIWLARAVQPFFLFQILKIYKFLIPLSLILQGAALPDAVSPPQNNIYHED